MILVKIKSLILKVIEQPIARSSEGLIKVDDCRAGLLRWVEINGLFDSFVGFKMLVEDEYEGIERKYFTVQFNNLAVLYLVNVVDGIRFDSEEMMLLLFLHSCWHVTAYRYHGYNYMIDQLIIDSHYPDSEIKTQILAFSERYFKTTSSYIKNGPYTKYLFDTYFNIFLKKGECSPDLSVSGPEERYKFEEGQGLAIRLANQDSIDTLFNYMNSKFMWLGWKKYYQFEIDDQKFP
jgi:hypothetical protein